MPKRKKANDRGKGDGRNECRIKDKVFKVRVPKGLRRMLAGKEEGEGEETRSELYNFQCT